jgi:fluoride exporter
MPDALTKTLWVGLGGFLGASARYWLGLWINAKVGQQFPWATFIINVSGSLVLGVLTGFLADRAGHSGEPVLRLLVAVGFLGAYTTFSTFELENLTLISAGQWGRAIANAAGSVVVGLLAVWLGARIGRGL